MRLPTAVATLIALAAPAAAGPLDTLQFRTTLGTDRRPTPGPASRPGEVAYMLDNNPAFGVVAAGVPDWTPASPAYPGAGFATVTLGRLTAFTSAEPWQDADVIVSAGGRYYLDVEIRDAAGRVATAFFPGRFSAAWLGGWHGYASPVFPVIDPGGDVGAPPMPVPPSASVWLGRTRYDVQLDYGWPPDYRQDEDGDWVPVWYPVDSVPRWDGVYWTQSNGVFYARVTATDAPEPGTLALAGLGLGGLLAIRRGRRRPQAPPPDPSVESGVAEH